MGCTNSKSSNVQTYEHPQNPSRGMQGSHAPQISERQKSRSFSNVKFETYEQAVGAIRETGLEVTKTICAIDFTKSNEWNGKFSNRGNSLHHIPPGGSSPYELILSCLIRLVQEFDDDCHIPMIAFGDRFPNCEHAPTRYMVNGGVSDITQMISTYRDYASKTVLSGPTSFAPVIRMAIEECKKEPRIHHTLFILTDGETTTVKEDKRAIIEASNYPLSICVIGVGDGNMAGVRGRAWEVMQHLDDEMVGQSKFDNFNFNHFPLNEPLTQEFMLKECMETIDELPNQYYMCKKLGYI